ncbi:hypothetical protein [Mariniradius sediminis]|uniref:MetA-pathway of phenol degradation n=1 Tax=Mariniradius sediminis TaxID=2909237 RepID=A0ABS9C113_9BACT|nr:hypothetical protein [Mariniradius sediminis]MCF1753126.1 hypothetical protein [Mariniradius sediminis]
MKKRVFLVISIVLSLVSEKVLAQESDSSYTEENYPKTGFIILSGKYQNAFTFLGRDFGQTIPFINFDAMYMLDGGLYMNLGAFKFLQTEVPFQYAATLGYAKELGKKTDVHLSYSQYFVTDMSEVIGIQNLGLLQTTFGLDWNVLYSTFQVQGLFNEHPDFFASMTHSRYFQFDQKLFKAVMVSFEPTFELLAGTSQFYWMGGFEESNFTSHEFSKFKLLSAEASMPLVFGIGGWDLEFETRYVMPMNTAEFDNSENRFVFSLGLSHAIPIQRKK